MKKVGLGAGLALIAALVLPSAAFAQAPVQSLKGELDITWVIVAAVLVLFMQAGFLFLEIGFSRQKNVGAGVAKILVNLGIATPRLVGGRLRDRSLSGNKFFGTDGFFFHFGQDIGAEAIVGGADTALMLFGMLFCAVSLAIVWGTTLERIKFGAYVIYAVVFAAVIYPLVAHGVYGGGLLADVGGKPVMDFAGSSVVHLTGAVGGLAALLLLGARKGKYGPDGKPRAIPGHSMPIVGLGVLILWVGWYGFNAGSTFGTGGRAVRPGRAEHPARGRGRRDRARCDRHLPEDEGARCRHGRQRRDRRSRLRSRRPRATSSSGPLRSSARSPGSSSSTASSRSTRSWTTRSARSRAHGLAGIWGTLSVGLFGSEPADPRRRRARASGTAYSATTSFSATLGQLGVQAVGVAATFVLVFVLSYATFARSRRRSGCASPTRRRKPDWTSPRTACTATRSSSSRSRSIDGLPSETPAPVPSAQPATGCQPMTATESSIGGLTQMKKIEAFIRHEAFEPIRRSCSSRASRPSRSPR